MKNRTTGLLVVQGILAILLGLFAIAWPGATLIVFGIAWGVYALIDGIGALVFSFTPGITRGSRFASAAAGVLGLVAGATAIAVPLGTASVISWLLGLWLLVRAGMLVMNGFALSGSAKWLAFLSAVLSLSAGIAFLANPLEAAFGIAWLFGIFALLWGAAGLVLAWTMRRQS